MKAQLVSNHYNLLYLTGFKGLSAEEREGWAIVIDDGKSDKQTHLITDGRYYSEAKKLPKIKVHQLSFESPLKKIFADILSTDSALLFEADDLTYHEVEQFKKMLAKLEKQNIDIKFLPLPEKESIKKTRSIKRANEIEKIAHACKVTDECFAELTSAPSKIQIKTGQTEREIAFNIEMWLKERNYELAFYPIVAINENAALPHYDTRAEGSAKVSNGCAILIDFGAKVDNYCADMTRMIAVGKPSDEFSKAYNDLLDVQEKSVNMLNTQAKYAAIDIQTREALVEKGYPQFMHATGHGLGLEIHEGPGVSMKSKDTVQPGHVVTIEPGIYIDGKFGVRIEDTVAIDKDGKPVVLTKTSKKLLVV